MTRNSARILASVSIMAMGWPVAVHAQQIAAAAQQSSAEQAPPADIGIADIVVTAQKRSENLQKTPAAVTALSGDALVSSGIKDLAAAQEMVPGARFHQEGNTTQVFLRGIGSNLDFDNVEPSVSFNYNGINMPREATSTALYDIERFEILPGPQGTLYGRSAIGGTINVAFRKPKFENSGYLDEEVGNYSLTHTTAVANVRLSNDFAMRAGVDYEYHSGYETTGSDSKDDISGRIGLLYKPTNDFSIYVWGATSHKHGNTPNLVNKGAAPQFDSSGNLTGFTYQETAFLNANPWDDTRSSALASTMPFGEPTTSRQQYHNWIGGLEIDKQLTDTISLTDIAGYVYLNATTDIYWLGALPAYKHDFYSNFGNELRLSGDMTRFKWLVGLVAYNNKSNGQGIVGSAQGTNGAPIPGTPFPFFSSDVLNNLAYGYGIYGQGTYSVTDALRVTLGARYGADTKTANGISLDDQTTPYLFHRAFRHADFKAGFEYDLATHVMVYATFQTGYQPGTFNEVAQLPGGGSNLVQSATMNGLSGGFKARLFDNRLQINDEIFYYDYKNLQIQAYNAAQLFNPIFNAAKVTIPGNQLDIVYKPETNTSINFSVAYTHNRNKDFVTPAGQSYNGLAGPYAADWTIGGGISHDFHLQSGYVRAAADARFESKWWADFQHDLGTEQTAYAKINANLTYYSEDGRWNVGIWGKNLTNKAVIAATAAAGIPGPGTAYLAPPRTFGARAGVKF